LPKRVLTGLHFMQGDIACAEGAVAAGCRFFAGYPITPRQVKLLKEWQEDYLKLGEPMLKWKMS